MARPNFFHLQFDRLFRLNQLNLEAIHAESRQLEEAVKRMQNGSISNDILQVRWPLGVPPQSMPDTRYDILTWTLMNETHQIMPNSEDNERLLSKIDREDIKVRLFIYIFIEKSLIFIHFFQRVLTRTLTEAKKIYPNLIYKQLHSLYRRFDPVRGMDYQIHMIFSEGDDRKVLKR